ncbi:hypothetical protein C8R44DRAFT_746375 [Mycena epipterygia]|nr:hypothetical protein C8R44DRAFT_746375 [Mycena epipterygia]
MRCRSRSRVSLPSPRQRCPPPLEDEVDVDAAAEDAANGGRSTDRDFERFRWTGVYRKRRSFDEGVAGTVGEVDAGVCGTLEVVFVADGAAAVVDMWAEVDGAVAATAWVPWALCHDWCARFEADIPARILFLRAIRSSVMPHKLRIETKGRTDGVA